MGYSRYTFKPTPAFRYILSNRKEKNRFESIENRSTAYNFQRSHQYPGFVEELGRKSADSNIQNIYHSANDRYITCSNPFRANLSPDRETERSASYKFCNNPIQKPNYIVSGSDSDLDKSIGSVVKKTITPVIL